MYDRALHLGPLVEKRSLFLFGPRQTGKSTLLRRVFPKAHYVDLLEANVDRELSAFPESLRQTTPPDQRLVIVDEVQKLPSLLDEAQAMLDRNPRLRFIFTGSSARKLRAGRANLLAGRAWVDGCIPWCRAKHRPRPSRDDSTWVAFLPCSIRHMRAVISRPMWDCTCRRRYAPRGWSAPSRRSRDSSRWLRSPTVRSSTTRLYRTTQGCPHERCGNTTRSSRTHWWGFGCRPFVRRANESRSRQRNSICSTLAWPMRCSSAARLSAARSSTGEHWSTWCFSSCAYLDYRRLNHELTLWRSHSGFEVDFLVGGRVAIEVKASGRVSPRDLRGLRALSDEVRLDTRIIVATEPRERRLDDRVVVWPVETFFRRLWAGEIIPEQCPGAFGDWVLAVAARILLRHLEG